MRFVALTSVEMRRALRRPVVQWMIVLAVFGCAFAGVIAFLTSRATDVPLDDHPATMTNWWGPEPTGQFLLTAALFLMIGAAVCGASVAGGEWRHGTIGTALTWEPVRWRLHGARTTSALVLAFLIALVLQVIFLAALLPAVVFHGTTTGTDARWWAGLLLAALRIAVATALVATAAVSIATIGRNTSAALVVMAAWALVGERTIAGLRPQLGRFLVAENVAMFVPWTELEDAPFSRPPLFALMTLVGYLALVVAAAFITFERRDVAAAS
jgi:hypothetical protein